MQSIQELMDSEKADLCPVLGPELADIVSVEVCNANLANKALAAGGRLLHVALEVCWEKQPAHPNGGFVRRQIRFAIGMPKDTSLELKGD